MKIKMLEIIKKHKKYCCIGVLLLLYSAFCMIFYQIKMKEIFENSLVAQVENVNNCDITVNEIFDGIIISQSFQAEEEISGFSLLFATLNRLNGISVQISIKEDLSDDVVFETSIEASTLVDNELVTFVCDKKLPAGSYTIFIESPGAGAGNAVTLWATSTDSYPDGNLEINGQKADGDMAFQIFGHSNAGIYQSIYLKITLIGLCLVLVLGYYLFIRKLEIEKMFLLCVIPLGLIYSVIFTPFDIPDEAIHENTAYYYSNKILFQEAEYLGESSIKGINSVHMAVRNEDLELQNADIKFRYDVLNSYRNGVFSKITGNTNLEDSIYSYAFILYLPAAIGITIARILNLSAIWLLYFGRFFNFAVYAALTYFGIKKTPFAKLMFFVTALLPMTLQQAISFSCDSIIYGLSFFLIGYCLYAAFGGEGFTKKNFAVLTVICWLTAPCKIVYVPICLLPFIISIKRFEHKKKYIGAMAVMLGGSAVSWLLFNAKSFLGVAKGGENWLTYANMEGFRLSFLWKEPLRFLEMLGNTLSEYGGKMITQAVGGQMGVLNIIVPGYLIAGFLILLLFSVLKEKNELVMQETTAVQKCWIALMAFGVFMAILISELLFWTPAAYSTIEGIQGRYFIPVIPMILLVIRNNQLVFQKNMAKAIISVCIILQILTVNNCFSIIAQM